MRRLAALIVVPGALWAEDARAAPGDAKRGLALARSGDCVAAVPLLERADAESHRPATASALAGCHVALGELLLAWQIYDALAREDPQKDWTPEDRAARSEAPERAAELDARLPRIVFALPPGARAAEAQIGDRTVTDLSEPIRASPDEKLVVRVSADGFEPYETTLVLAEGEKKTLRVPLRAIADRADPPKPPGKGDPAPAGPQHWIGARFRGLLVPTFVMNIVADGGTTTYWPGGFLTFTTRVSDVDLVPSIGVTSYQLGETPFKPHDTPDTEWEYVSSDLVGLTISLDVLYAIPLTASEDVALKIGGGFGFGWAFAGELYRTQSYPKSGEPGDPATYRKCKGPNDPPGTFRYCNQLDKDAHRYGGPDKTWHDGGARPVVYPWLVLPEVALAWKPVDEFALDFELGLTLNGFLTGVGGRYGF